MEWDKHEVRYTQSVGVEYIHGVELLLGEEHFYGVGHTRSGTTHTRCEIDTRSGTRGGYTHGVKHIHEGSIR